MKKLSIALTALLSGLSAMSQANANNFCVIVPNFGCGGFNLEVDGLYLRTDHNSSNRDFFVSDAFDANRSTDSVNNDRFDRDNDRDHRDWNWGWKVAAGYAFPCSGNDVLLAYTHYNNHHNHGLDQISETICIPDNIFLFPLVALVPAFGQSIQQTTPFLGDLNVPVCWSFAIPGTTSFSNSVRENVVDLDVGQHTCVGSNTHLRWFAGGRWANLERKFDVNFNGSTSSTEATGFTVAPLRGIDASTAGPLGNGEAFFQEVTFVADADFTGSLTEFVSERSRFNGVGPRTGLDGTYTFGCSGFGITASASISLLIGEKRHNLHRDVTGDATTVINDVTLPDGSTTVLDSFGNSIALIDPSLLEFTGTSVHSSFDRHENIKFRDETRVVPNVDAKIALSYDYCYCKTKWKFEAGYLVSYYWNATDTLTLDFCTCNERGRRLDDLSFDGPYVGVKVQL